MPLTVPHPYPPAEAKQVEAIPEGDAWRYEPKWDGFRCVVFRDGDDVRLQSKSLKPLGRYFPELLDRFRSLGAQRFVLDGEIVVPVGDVLSFEMLLQRIHPAESRVRKLATSYPAAFVAFDLLLAERGDALLDRPFDERRERLERFAERYFPPASDGPPRLIVSPHSTDIEDARPWLAGRAGLDGVVAKRADLPYASGERTAMQKIKRYRSADCVVGGFRYASKGREVGSLLLGLFDDEGLLHHVGFTSNMPSGAARAALTEELEARVAEPGFTGNAPGGPSRWSTERSSQWQPLRPELVVEVRYDHFSERRFRHGTSFLRWRPDKAPEQCTFAALAAEGASSLTLLDG